MAREHELKKDLQNLDTENSRLRQELYELSLKATAFPSTTLYVSEGHPPNSR